MSERTTQLNSLLQQEIGTFFHQEVPEVFVSVTKVEVAPDIKEALVWVSFLTNRGSNMDELKRSLHTLHRYLRTRLHTKNIPNIKLHLDTGIEYAERITELLDPKNQS